MITSAQTSLLSELRQKPLPQATLVEMEERLQLRIHSMILEAFNKSGLTQKELADRLGWDNARISRLLGSPSNLTLGTISALLSAIGVDFDDPTFTTFDELERRLTIPTVPVRVTRAQKRMSRTSASAQMDLFLVRAMHHAVGEAHTPSPVLSLPTGETRSVKDVVQPRTYNGKVAVLAEYRSRKLGENDNLLIGERRYA